jgi:hypothetical protein
MIGDQGSEIRDQAPRWRRYAGPGLILLSAVVATLPQMLRGPSCGHDFDFHLVSWMDALHSWRQGIIYPHWTPTPNFEAGEPRFVFYPPLTWMLGAVLGAILPWHAVPQVMVFLLLAATGLATRVLARQAFNDNVATLAGCAAIFSGYALFTAYERSAYAEMTGGFWTPLLLMLILRERSWSPTLATKTKTSRGWGTQVLLINWAPDRTAFLMALVIAGAWLSNAPLGVMVSYLLAGISVTVALLVRSWIPVLQAAAAVVLGLGLSAFFWIPAAWEQRWVAIRQAVDDPGLLIENSWLFARHADPRLELHDIELIRVSGIAVTMVAVALGGLAIMWWRRTLPERRWWLPLALIPAVVLFLELPISDFVWNGLPKMRFLQFPWRWLVVLEAPMAIFFAAGVWPKRRLLRMMVTALCCAAFVAATGFALVSLFQGCDEDDEVSGILRVFRDGTGVQGTDEYAPPDADNSLIPTGLPFACLVSDPAQALGKGDPDMTPDWSPEQGSCDAIYADTERSAERRYLRADVPHAGYLVLRLRRFPAWRVTLNGQTVAAMPSRPDGLMAVRVQRGAVELAADWTRTQDVLAGRLISIVSLVLITVPWFLERRRTRARL